jgi:oxygen-dependent protoporphyrinogen oxidase
VVVVGAGVAGLAAAHELSGRVVTTVVEAGPRAGGKILTTPFAGLAVDCAADAFLARVPDAVELCRRLGLGDELVTPAATSAQVLRGGRLRRLPTGLVLGVPTDLDALAASGLVSPAAVARAAEDLARDPADPVELAASRADESVGALVRRRLGDEVFETLVDPLLSGVNAGRADELSVAAGAAQLAAAARADTSLVRALRAQVARAGGGAGPGPSSETAFVAAGAAGCRPAPVFLTVVGGMGRIVERLVARIGAHRTRVGAPVAILERAPGNGAGGYRLAGPGWPGGGGADLRVDGVVLATPAPVTAALVRPASPAAAGLLEAIDYASVALVSYAFRADEVGRPLDASGFLVPRAAGLLLTACSWSSSKFAHLGGDGVVRLRASAGRHDDQRQATLGDDRLADRLRDDLATTMGLTVPPIETRVSRWPASLPQYRPGHLERVDAIEAALAEALPGVHLAGAAYRGLGVPACIASGRAAARAALAST